MISAIRSVRARWTCRRPEKARWLLSGADKDVHAGLEKYAEALSRMARVESCSFADKAPKSSLQTVVGGIVYALPLAGLIDMDAEKARINSNMDKTKAEIEKIDKKLSNPNFVEKAPAAVVEEQKSRKAAFERNT